MYVSHVNELPSCGPDSSNLTICVADPAGIYCALNNPGLQNTPSRPIVRKPGLSDPCVLTLSHLAPSSRSALGLV